MTFIELSASVSAVSVENTDTATTYSFAILGDPFGDYTLELTDPGRDKAPITAEQDEEAEAAKAFADTVVKRMRRNKE